MKPKTTLRSFLALAGSSLLAISFAHAQSTRWFDGGDVDILVDGNSASTGGAGTWNTTILNWDAGAVPHVAWNNANADNAVIAGSGTLTVGVPVTVGALTLSYTSGTRTVSGSTITINSGITFGNLAGLTWTAPIILGGDQTWSHGGNNSTAKSITGGTNLNGNTLTWNSTNTTSNSGITHSAITGNGSIIKNGTGWLALSGTNTYTGSTTVNTGSLSMGSATALGNVNNQLTVNGGTLNMVSRSLTVGDLTGTGGVITGSSGTRLLTIGSGDAGGGNFQGAIQDGSGGTTALTKTGTGAITLSGTNIYTGATNVNAGVLNVTGTLTSAVTVADNAALSGTGTTTGTLALSNGSTIVGTTTGSSFRAETVTATGVAGVNIAGSIGGGTIDTHTIGVVRYNTGTGPDTANFSTAGYRSVTSLTNVGGAGGETQLTYTNQARTWNSASGTWDAMTATTWQEGDTRFSQGDVITFDDTGTGGGSARAVTLSSLVTPGSVTFNNSTSTPYTVSGTGIIAGLSGLTKSGSGTVVLGNAYNTYSGGTTVSAGTLLVNNTTGSGTGSGAVTVGAAAALGGDGTVGGNVTFNDTSIFAWNLSVTTPANTASATVADTFVVTGTLTDGGSTGGSVFKVLLAGSQTFADTFWTANQSWTNVLTSGNGIALETLFTSFSYANADGAISLSPSIGSFSLTGTTLNFQAIPEPSTALAGLLLAAGLLRRRRGRNVEC